MLATTWWPQWRSCSRTLRCEPALKDPSCQQKYVDSALTAHCVCVAAIQVELLPSEPLPNRLTHSIHLCSPC